MCQSDAYLIKNGGEKELFMKDVSSIKPQNNELLLEGLMGEQKKIKARIKELLLTDHTVILEPLE